ncbi:c-type cytochrome [Rivibacter subsaxonicus]|uniref:Cbb3-type cytochrome c oxidase subunit III n=1 Tax=Rivibacter subsaxonicus TaxID=457575 RepID=A0A4Q7VEL9_9BURK|nr:c-type cytochrome [Rivibacter subsaxonicus]RZT93642.1 cbb3-type cytochrome c oxidase subunit III [Rivibacter subsaxonicus]
MKTWIRRGLIAVFVLALLAGGAIWVGLRLGDARHQRVVQVPTLKIELPTDPASLERGAYLYRSRGCAECHGQNGEGRVFADNQKDLRLAGPHIGPHSALTAGYQVEDWVRVIRHGVKPAGHPVFVMPSEDYNRLSRADLGALVAHLQRLPATQGGPAVLELPLPARVMYGFGALKDAAEKIDHTLPPSEPIADDGSARHGEYVAQMCLGCHGPGLVGGRIPGAPPDWPPAADLRRGGPMKLYASTEQFTSMMRTGKRPDGSAVSPVMPFTALKELSDIDLRGLHAYLQTLPPAAP